MAASAVALSACATVPNLGPRPEPKAAASYAVQASLQAPAADWPQDRWWTGYGDAQLDALIDEALASSPDLAQAAARVSRANALAQQAGAALTPQVAANAQASLTKQSYNNGFPAAYVPQGWNDTGLANLSLGYDLDLWGKNRAALAAATSAAEAARAAAAMTRLALSTSIAAAYADLAQLHAERDAAQAAADARVRTAGLIAERAANGLETQAPVKRAEAGQASAEAQIAAIDESIGLTRNRIAALMGQGPDRGLAIQRPQAAALKAFGLPETVQADLIGRRPDVVAARLRAEAASSDIKSAKADFYPNIRLSALIGVQSLGLEWLTRAGSGYGSVGPAISLPIFDGGRLQGAYRGARADYDLAVASYDSAVTQALREVADVAVSQKALQARLDRSRQALAASEAAYRIAQDRYRGGLSSYLEVLSAEDALIADRRAVAELQTRAFTLDVALVRALGGGFQS